MFCVANSLFLFYILSLMSIFFFFKFHHTYNLCSRKMKSRASWHRLQGLTGQHSARHGLRRLTGQHSARHGLRRLTGEYSARHGLRGLTGQYSGCLGLRRLTGQYCLLTLEISRSFCVIIKDQKFQNLLGTLDSPSTFSVNQ